MDILNIEFSCKDELLILPKHYCTLDSEYNFNSNLHEKVSQCRNFDNVQFMHFNAKGKPWTHDFESAKSHYTETYEPVVKEKYNIWFRHANQICPSNIQGTLD